MTRQQREQNEMPTTPQRRPDSSRLSFASSQDNAAKVIVTLASGPRPQRADSEITE